MCALKKVFNIDNISEFKAQLLEWSKRFNDIVWLDSNSYNQTYGQYDAILAVDALTVLSTNSTSAFEELKCYQNEINDWIFGHLNYDLKNSVEQLSSSNFDGLDFPELQMFQPKRMIFWKQILLFLNMMKLQNIKSIQIIKLFLKLKYLKRIIL